jgi:predicted lactoylglutathione lyase
VLVALSCASDQEVKDLVAKASASGGRAAREARDHGFMYEHAFEDPDGHIWELVHMREQPK